MLRAISSYQYCGDLHILAGTAGEQSNIDTKSRSFPAHCAGILGGPPRSICNHHSGLKRIDLGLRTSSLSDHSQTKNHSDNRVNKHTSTQDLSNSQATKHTRQISYSSTQEPSATQAHKSTRLPKHTSTLSYSSTQEHSATQAQREQPATQAFKTT